MITRAQAEALLTPAESLEACERLGVHLGAEPKKAFLVWGFGKDDGVDLDGLQSFTLRLAVNALIPKQET